MTAEDYENLKVRYSKLEALIRKQIDSVPQDVEGNLNAESCIKSLHRTLDWIAKASKLTHLRHSPLLTES